MSVSKRTRARGAWLALITAILLSVCPLQSLAASISGVVTDATGKKVTGAKIVLLSKGKVIATAVSVADGSFQITTGTSGRCFLVVSASTFRQIQTPAFYAGTLDNIQRNIVLEPEWARESIVVTATGTPTPQPQTSAATSVLGPQDIAQRDDFAREVGAYLLADKAHKPLKITKVGEGLDIAVPTQPLDSIATVVVLNTTN